MVADPKHHQWQSTKEEARALQKTWSNDIPCLRMYHVLIDDKLCAAFTWAFAIKTKEEFDGRNSGMFKSYYEQAAQKFNNKDWVPASLSLPDLHDNFAESKLLVLNVMPITPEFFHRKFADVQYKMIKSDCRLGKIRKWARTICQNGQWWWVHWWWWPQGIS